MSAEGVGPHSVAVSQSSGVKRGRREDAAAGGMRRARAVVMVGMRRLRGCAKKPGWASCWSRTARSGAVIGGGGMAIRWSMTRSAGQVVDNAMMSPGGEGGVGWVGVGKIRDNCGGSKRKSR